MAAPPPEKLRHLALCLPLLGLFLLMPPALLVFGVTITLAGVPLIVLYMFGVWALLIAGAAVLARYLRAGMPIDPQAAGEEKPADPLIASPGFDPDQPT